jgi:uracil-DNA glycosylase
MKSSNLIFHDLMESVGEEYKSYTCYPPQRFVFAAFFNYCNFNDLKVVIIGQDPYHGKGEITNGLSFCK